MKFDICESEITFIIVPYVLSSFYPNICGCFCMVIPVVSHWKQNDYAFILRDKQEELIYIAGKIPGKYAN